MEFYLFVAGIILELVFLIIIIIIIIIICFLSQHALLWNTLNVSPVPLPSKSWRPVKMQSVPSWIPRKGIEILYKTVIDFCTMQ